MPMTGRHKIVVADDLKIPSGLFQDDFETGNFSKWGYQNQPSKQAIVMSPVHGGTYAARFHYHVTGTGENIDDNVWAGAVFTSAREVYIRFYHRWATPTDDPSDLIVQKKLFYISDSTSPSDILGNYQVVLDAWNCWEGVYQPGNLYLNWFSQGTGGVGIPANPWQDLGVILHFDTWYCIEMRIYLNTPGEADGIIQAWINGSLVYTLTDCDHVRGTWTGNLSMIAIGNQVNITDAGTADDYRYWDDLVLSTSYVGT